MTFTQFTETGFGKIFFNVLGTVISYVAILALLLYVGLLGSKLIDVLVWATYGITHRNH